jgi:ABC-type ATPase with predicted acetyltransferase domain
MTIQEMNRQLSTINRVVIHPKYRTVGLGARLIRETLPLAGTPYVELIAVMAKYSPTLSLFVSLLTLKWRWTGSG